MQLIGLNDAGHRVGQFNPAAVLTDRDVELMLRMRAAHGWGYKRLAKAFEVSASQARNICKGLKRAQVATRWVEVRGRHVDPAA